MNVRKEGPYGDLLFGQMIASMILLAILGGYSLVTSLSEDARARREKHERTAVQHRNEFYEMVAGKRDVDKDVVWGELAIDMAVVREIEQARSETDDAPASRLIPTSLAEVEVAGQYGDINETLDMRIVDDDPSTSSDNGTGPFSAEFISSYDLAAIGKLDRVIKPLPSVDRTYNVMPFGVPVLPYIGLLLTVGGIVGFGFMSSTTGTGYMGLRREGWYWRYNKEYLKQTVSILWAWPIAIPFMVLYRLPVSVYRKFETDAQRKAAEVTAKFERIERMKRNPVALELAEAQENLTRLQALPQVPEVKKAVKDTEKLVYELSQFEEVLTDRQARLIAERIAKRNIELRDRPVALLAAKDELNVE